MLTVPDHVLLTRTFSIQFCGNKTARIFLVEFHSSASLLLSLFSPGVIKFEVFRLKAQIKGNDMTKCLHCRLLVK